MRCKRLSSEDRAIVGDWRFKAFGVNAFIGDLAMLFALLFTADTRDVPQEVPESATEDVAFV